MLPEIRTILYATDLEEHAPRVFGHAVALAQRFEARLVLLYAIEPIGATASGLVRSMVPEGQLEELHREGMRQVREDIEARLDRLRESEPGARGGSSLVSEIRVIEEHPATAILDQAKVLEADLIVMGTHGRTGVREFMLGSVAHKVMQRSRVPVFLVPLRGAA